MKLTYFCPECWRELDGQTTECPHCGHDLAAYEQLPFEQKLLRAVWHPVQDNRLLAIQLLGRLKSAAAVPVFQAVLDVDVNFFVIREIASALAQIGDASSLRLLQQLTTHKLPMVQRVAQDLLIQVAGTYNGEGDRDNE